MTDSHKRFLGNRALSPETLMMGYGYDPFLSERSLKPPVFQTSTFVFRSAQDGKEFFELAYGLRQKRPNEEPGLIYSRINNPDLEMLEDRLAIWDQAEASLVFASGMAAISSPNLAAAHGHRGATLIFSGRPKEGLAALETCIRLDPRDPFMSVRLLHIACGLYFSREYDATVEAAKRLILSYPDFPMIYRWPAAALGQLGRVAEAKEALEKAISLAPTAFDMYVRKRVPWFRPEDHAHLLEGLRKAGWKEQ